MALPRSIVAPLFLVAGLGLSAAQAQVHQVAFTTDDDDPFGAGNTDAGVSVNGNSVVSTSNMRVSLFNKSGGSLATFQVGDAGWPFIRVDPIVNPTTGPSRFFDPQTVYHPQSGRLWMIYCEENAGKGTGDNELSALHLALTRPPTGGMTGFGNADWWYYTGPSTTPGNGGQYFDLQQTMLRYPEGVGPHNPLTSGIGQGLIDKPHMAVDEQAAYVTMNANDIADLGMGPTQFNFNAILIIPLEHGTTSNPLSILDGDKPAPGDLTFVRNFDLPEQDKHEKHYAVQEPFEQVDNAQFFISLDQKPIVAEKKNTVRLGGLWFEAGDPGRWHYSQRIETDGTGLEDMDVNVGGSFDFATETTYQPATPSGSFSPRVSAATAYFPGAVLVKDTLGRERIFAVHHVNPVDSSGNALPQWIIQWYVIDPDLANFRTAPAPSTAWRPSIEVTGRLATAGDRYHPVIGVTQQGVAYIEYTFSDGNIWPEVRRAQLGNSYTGIVPNSEVTVEQGENNPYLGALNGWADFADMQADPSNSCAFWSVHTLVHEDDLTVNDKRDVWLFETLFNCGNSNLNGDSGTDLFDMAMFNDFYSTGARRVDMNTDGTTDAADAAIYADEYDKATGP